MCVQVCQKSGNCDVHNCVVGLLDMTVLSLVAMPALPKLPQCSRVRNEPYQLCPCMFFSLTVFFVKDVGDKVGLMGTPLCGSEQTPSTLQERNKTTLRS